MKRRIGTAWRTRDVYLVVEKRFNETAFFDDDGDFPMQDNKNIIHHINICFEL